MKHKTPFFAMLLLVCTGANAAGSQPDFVRAPVRLPEFVDPFGGYLIYPLGGFIYGLFQSQTTESTEPAEINDVPIATFMDDSDLYDKLLQP